MTGTVEAARLPESGVPSSRRSGSASCARPFHVRVHPSVHGRELSHGAVCDECDDGVGRLSLDRHTARRPKDLHGGPRKSQRGRGHRAVLGFSGAPGEERTCRSTAACRAEDSEVTSRTWKRGVYSVGCAAENQFRLQTHYFDCSSNELEMPSYCNPFRPTLKSLMFY